MQVGSENPVASAEPNADGDPRGAGARRAMHQRRGRPLLWLGIIAAVLLLLVALGFWALKLVTIASTGRTEAAAAARSLLSGDTGRAETQFAKSARTFAGAKDLLGPDWLLRPVEAIPWVGRQVAAVDALVTIGMHGSDAGGQVAGLVGEMSSRKDHGHILSTASGRQHVDAALTSLCAAAARTPDLADVGLLDPLASAARAVSTVLQPVSSILDRCDSIAEFERFLFSEQRRFLVVSQHPGEIKPTGGFIGSYGILQIGPKKLGLDSYQDIYFLSVPPELHIPSPPGDILTTWFKFRDANWWLDYPTSARALLMFWQEYGQDSVDGVIAIDTEAMSALLEVLGPVKVAGHDETFTADNLLERLNYLIETEAYERAQAGEKVSREDKKAVLAALANRLADEVLGGDAMTQMQSALALARTADQKHLQFYFVDEQGQSLARGIGWSGSLDPVEGTTDLVAVSNAMNRAAKSNMGVRKRIDYRVALGADGSAESSLSLRYANTAAYETPPRQRSVFSNYLQVYRSPGAVALPGPGIAPAGSATTEVLGLPVEIRPFQLPRGRIHTEVIRTRLSQATLPGRAARPSRAPATDGGWAVGSLSHYRLQLVRQSDLEDVPTSITVTPPPGVRIAGSSAWKAASGDAVPTVVDGGSVRLETPLDGDLVLDVDLVATPFGW